MATLTTNYEFNLPVIGGDIDVWGGFINANFTLLDNILHGSETIRPDLATGLWEIGGVPVTSTAAELNILDGATLSVAELNMLDGYTGNTADLNILAGAAAGGLTAAELLFVNGATSNIQTQLNAVSALATVAAPSGAVMFFAMDAAPAGWLQADGSAVSRATYAALFAAIGTTFGVGDGSTTFNLPDLRGEFIRGWDDARGIDSGRVFGSAQDDEFQSHTHSQTVDGPDQDRGAAAGTRASGTNVAYGTQTSTASTLAAGGTETRPRNIALLACIKT